MLLIPANSINGLIYIQYKSVFSEVNIKFVNGRDYSGAKFFFTEPISLNKAHSTK